MAKLETGGKCYYRWPNESGETRFEALGTAMKGDYDGIICGDHPPVEFDVTGIVELPRDGGDRIFTFGRIPSPEPPEPPVGEDGLREYSFNGHKFRAKDREQAGIEINNMLVEASKNAGWQGFETFLQLCPPPEPQPDVVQELPHG